MTNMVDKAAKATDRLIAENARLRKALVAVDACMDAFTPGADSELSNAECARLWNATRKVVTAALEAKP